MVNGLVGKTKTICSITALSYACAFDDGYDVYIVTDASWGVAKEAHDASVQRMVQGGAQRWGPSSIQRIDASFQCGADHFVDRRLRDAAVNRQTCTVLRVEH